MARGGQAGSEPLTALPVEASMRSTNHSFNESLQVWWLTFILVGMSARPPEILSLFASRLKARRLALGLPQQALGEALGLEGRIAQSRISRYEIELHTPDLKTAYELAEVLGVSLSELEELEAQLAALVRPATEPEAAEDEVQEEDSSVEAEPANDEEAPPGANIGENE